MKDEQRRKVDQLYQQYEEAVQKMLDQENVRRKSTRMRDRECEHRSFRFN